MREATNDTCSRRIFSSWQGVLHLLPWIRHGSRLPPGVPLILGSFSGERRRLLLSVGDTPDLFRLESPRDSVQVGRNYERMSMLQTSNSSMDSPRVSRNPWHLHCLVALSHNQEQLALSRFSRKVLLLSPALHNVEAVSRLPRNLEAQVVPEVPRNFDAKPASCGFHSLALDPESELHDNFQVKRASEVLRSAALKLVDVAEDLPRD